MVVGLVAMPRGGAKAATKESAKLQVEWEVGCLATLWEQDDVIRARGRQNLSLTRWPNPKCKGIPSMKSIHLNSEALLHIATRWCKLLPHAKSPPVPLLSAEACHLTTHMFEYYSEVFKARTPPFAFP